MIINPRNKPTKPTELQLLHYLNIRIPLATNVVTRLEKGFKGEKQFHELLEANSPPDCIILYDLLLESNQTQFQIDCLLIFEREIYLIEVKNFEGDFYVSDDKWYAVASKQEVRNPLLQLQRSEFLLRHLLTQLGYNFLVKPYIVFVNQAFTLYQAPFNQSLIFPGQLNRFINQLNETSAKLTSNHSKLAQQLVDRHIEQSIYKQLPDYNYDQLKKGMFCCFCDGFLMIATRGYLRCKNCDRKEELDRALMRSVEEFNLLFPDQKITTSIIQDWCKIIHSKKTIRRILMKNMTHINQGRSSYYIFQK